MVGVPGRGGKGQEIGEGPRPHHFCRVEDPGSVGDNEESIHRNLSNRRMGKDLSMETEEKAIGDGVGDDTVNHYFTLVHTVLDQVLDRGRPLTAPTPPGNHRRGRRVRPSSRTGSRVKRTWVRTRTETTGAPTPDVGKVA